MSSRQQKILGDYQTPMRLARQVVARLFERQSSWQQILEPTCGVGNFVRACLEHPRHIERLVGIEVQPGHARAAMAIESRATNATILCQDIFRTDFASMTELDVNAPTLIVGNPPWVTNAEQGRLRGSNLPSKSNSQNLSGLDALTGKSNFDIAEAVWRKLLDAFGQSPVTIALLCKLSVARKIASVARAKSLRTSEMSMYCINAKKWFGVSAEACLFVLELNQGETTQEVAMYNSLSCVAPLRRLAFVGNRLVSDARNYEQVKHLDGNCRFDWRQGVKHDASKVMELEAKDGRYINGFGEALDIEEEFIYPLVKSSDLRKVSVGLAPRKFVILTQTRLNQDTTGLASIAPKLWAYLHSHRERFDARKSSVYRNAPHFAMFGVGDYTFSEYKVATSGFYLPPAFAMLHKHNEKQYVVDDTCYSLSFNCAWQAAIVWALLSHNSARQLLASLVFSDAKRPITKQALSRIDLAALYESIGYLKLMGLARGMCDERQINLSLPARQQVNHFLRGRQAPLL